MSIESNQHGQEIQLLDKVSMMENEEFETLRDLVKIDTVNPYCGDTGTHDGERKGQAYLSKKLEASGFSIQFSDIPSTVFDGTSIIAPRNRLYANRPNLQGILRFDAVGPIIVLNGHMDTVGIEGMSANPFSGSILDGKLFGRGSSDDKAGLVGALYAVKALSFFKSSLAGTIIFQSVADEECSGSGSGTLALCKAGLKADMAIVVDGLDLEIQRGSKGTMTMEVEVTGKSAHASEGEGVNAIEKALLLKDAVDDFIAVRKAKAPGYKVNLGIFRGGTVPSIIPDKASFVVNIDYSLSEAEASSKQNGTRDGSLIRDELSSRILQKAYSDAWLNEHLPKITCIKDLYPFEIGEDSALVLALADSYRDVRGLDPIVTKGSWCDAAHLSVFADIPAVVFGPLVKAVVHGVDEYVKLNELIDFTKILSLALFRLLKK